MRGRDLVVWSEGQWEASKKIALEGTNRHTDTGVGENHVILLERMKGKRNCIVAHILCLSGLQCAYLFLAIASSPLNITTYGRQFKIIINRTNKCIKQIYSILSLLAIYWNHLLRQSCLNIKKKIIQSYKRKQCGTNIRRFEYIWIYLD